jgi:hypothetical protein
MPFVSHIDGWGETLWPPCELLSAFSAFVALFPGPLDAQETPLDDKLRQLPTTKLSRPCPVGAKKLVRGGATWSQVRSTVASSSRNRPGSGGNGEGSKVAMPMLFYLCGDISGASVFGDAKYGFGSTGAWWRAKMAAAERVHPSAHATPLFDVASGGANDAWHVAVHIRRGDMVYRNFYKQL